MGHAGIGQLAVIGEAEDLEVRELREGRHPVVVELRRDDVERLERREVADVLEESRIIRIVLAVVVRPGARYGEVEELHALAVGGELDLALCGGDDADDRFGVRIKGVG